MNKHLLKFWVTCPKCKQKFGVNPETVLYYLDRLFEWLKETMAKKSETTALLRKTEEPEKPEQKP